MPTPFPGMDPYLEHPQLWPDVHLGLVSAVRTEEIAASSAAYDLHDKRRVYARSGVQEYLAAQAYERRVDWFALREGVYEALSPDDSGILCFLDCGCNRLRCGPAIWPPCCPCSNRAWLRLSTQFLWPA